jgi:uncharacterized membrane protein YidH (DUF202 family)
VGSVFERPDRGQEAGDGPGETAERSTRKRDPRGTSETGWLIAWVATCLFAVGAAVLAFALVSGESGPYGVTAVGALVLCGFGIGALGLAAAAWTRAQPRARWRSRRLVAAFIALLAAVVLLALLVADLRGWLSLLADSWPLPVAGVSALVIGAVLAAPHAERRPTLAFAGIWLLLLGTVAYRTWTDLRVEVVWLGPNIATQNPGQVAFIATRSGDFEVRVGARTCSDGRAIGDGRYTWRPGDPGSSFGAPAWVDLPASILPLHPGDLVRICVRDGLAAGSAAGEAATPPSFWPRN